MPVKPTYPGVYVEELPSGVRTIVGVATSTTAFIGHFPRGPGNAAVRAFNVGDFERDFGGLNRDSPATYAISQFFLNGGTEAWIVRVPRADASGTVAETAALMLEDDGGTDAFGVLAGRRVEGESVEDPGDWGNNLRLEVDYNTSDPVNRFNLVVTEETTEGGELQILRTEEYRNLSTDSSDADYALEEVNARSRLIQLEEPTGSLLRPAATGTLGDAIAARIADMTVTPSDGDGFDVTDGSETLSCTLDLSSAPTTAAQLRPLLTTAIRTAAAASTLSDDLKSVLEDAVVLLEPADEAATEVRFRLLSGRGSGYAADRILSFTNLPAAGWLGLDGGFENVQKYEVGSGTAGAQNNPVLGVDGDDPTATELVGARASKTGLYALENVDIFNILCIPEVPALGDAAVTTVYSAAETYCLERRAFLLLDIPEDTATLDAMEAWISDNSGLRHRNAAVYFPRPVVPDPLNNYRGRAVPASGTIAGLYARTDADRGVWKAPAGTEARLRGVQELAYVLTDQENGVLNPIGVNCLRTFPVTGTVAWGARSLVGADVLASDWKYVSVRRIALFIEESLYRGTQWAVFEPNDEPLWSQLRLNVGAFMHNLFRQGAFQGTSPDEAYLVKCDDETTTQTDIDQGIVNILVGFAPLKPAEFVIVKIQQLAGQTEA